MEPSDAIRKQQSDVPSVNSDNSSTDDSDTELRSTLTDKYKEVVTAFEDIIDLLRSDPSSIRDQPKDRFRQAKKVCQNLLSMVLSWACDIRINDDNLDQSRDTIIGYVVQTSLGQIKSQLRSLVLQDAEAISMCVVVE